jgi:glutamine amidotransferase
MIGIIDYGMGNLTSVFNALQSIGQTASIITHPGELKGCNKLILPGVGAFGKAMKNLEEGGWLEELNKEVVELQKPLLGICLGMQLVADSSEEFGKHQGLGWIAGDVVLMDPPDDSLRIPQIGWNNVAYPRESKLYHGIDENTDFYFVHSFHFQAADPAVVNGVCDYGMQVVASVEKDNIFAVQFHPEKSGPAGLTLLKNFSEIDHA